MTTKNVDQKQVSLLASRALQQQRSSLLQLPVRIRGETPLLMHRWSQKALLQMLGKMVGIDMPRLSKDLTNDYDESWYRNINDELALPCRIIKASIVEGAITTGKVVSKMELKRNLRVLGYTTPIRLAKDTEMEMNVSIVRTSGMSKAPDVRARAVIPPGWHCDIVLQFPKLLSVDKVVSALTGAGSAIGLCDFRCEKGGDFGCFDIEFFDGNDAKHIKRILKECSIQEDQPDIPPQYLRAFNAVAPEEKKKIVKKVPPMTPHAKKNNGATTNA